jgi:hypothetical protein
VLRKWFIEKSPWNQRIKHSWRQGCFVITKMCQQCEWWWQNHRWTNEFCIIGVWDVFSQKMYQSFENVDGPSVPQIWGRVVTKLMGRYRPGDGLSIHTTQQQPSAAASSSLKWTTMCCLDQKSHLWTLWLRFLFTHIEHKRCTTPLWNKMKPFKKCSTFPF